MEKVYRLTSVILLVALLSIFMCVPASALDLEGDADIYSFRVNSSYPNGLAVSHSLVYPHSADYFKIYSVNSSSSPTKDRISALNVPLTDVAGNVIVSISYVLGYSCAKATGNGWSCSFPLFASPSASMEYTNHFGQTGTGYAEEVTSFSFPGGISTDLAYSYWSPVGLSTTCTFVADDLHPISNLKIIWPECYYTECEVTSTSRSVQANCYITSFRVISTGATSAEVVELEEIASQIAQSNSILSAMYADILSVCNSIYSRCGDMLEAQQLTNTYFESIIPVLNSISTNTANIYNLLSQQFSLLISTIESESDDIQSTIDNAVDTLIAYFDNVFSSSVNPALPGQSEDITSGGNEWHNAEADYQSAASQRFESLVSDFDGYSGGVLGGISLANTLFMRVWDTLGEYQIVYLTPLILALCLVVLGRLSRTSMGSAPPHNSNAVGDEKRLPPHKE